MSKTAWQRSPWFELGHPVLDELDDKLMMYHGPADPWDPLESYQKLVEDKYFDLFLTVNNLMK